MRNFQARVSAHAAHLIRQFTRGRRDDTSGIAAIEFAIVVPFLLLGIVGAVDLGIGIYRDMEVRDAAQAGAQYAVVNGFNASNVSAAVTSATPYSSVAVSPAPKQFCGCATTAGVTNTTCGSVCPNGYTAGTYVSVSAAATYYPSLLYSTVFPKSFALTAQSTVRIK